MCYTIISVYTLQAELLRQTHGVDEFEQMNRRLVGLTLFVRHLVMSSEVVAHFQRYDPLV